MIREDQLEKFTRIRDLLNTEASTLSNLLQRIDQIFGVNGYGDYIGKNAGDLMLAQIKEDGSRVIEGLQLALHLL